MIEPLFSSPVYMSDDLLSVGEDMLERVNSFKSHPNYSNMITDSYDVLNDDKMSDIRHFCIKHLNVYVRDFLKCKNEIYITTSWLNYTQKGQSHHLHNHPNSLISGVLYLSGQNINITFMRSHPLFCLNLDYERVSNVTAERWNQDSCVGQILLFPSSLVHLVEGNFHDKVRISLSFNTFVKGGVNNTTNRLDLK